MFEDADFALLRCPGCKGPLRLRGREQGVSILRCLACGFCAREHEGLFDLHREAEVRGTDRWMRRTYDAFPLQHDFGMRFFLPIMQDGVTESALRDRFLKHLALDRLRPRDDGEPVRILEVGMGTGSNMPELVARCPRGLPVELWGCDLSEGMLRRGMRRLRRWRFRGPDGRPARVVLADAHALPFASSSFDRVFHAGGIGVFRDPGLAMREMARVARPGSEVLVVDENLDPGRWHDPLHRYWFWTLTALDPDPHPPRERVPEGCTITADVQISRFYYCLVFRTPERASTSRMSTS